MFFCKTSQKCFFLVVLRPTNGKTPISDCFSQIQMLTLITQNLKCKIAEV